MKICTVLLVLLATRVAVGGGLATASIAMRKESKAVTVAGVMAGLYVAGVSSAAVGIVYTTPMCSTHCCDPTTGDATNACDEDGNFLEPCEGE